MQVPSSLIPPPTADARKAFRQQVQNSIRRGIPFLFSFEEWWEWWNAEPGRWEQRGVGKRRLAMARHGDNGAYEPGNVLPLTNSQNASSVDPERIRRGIQRAIAEGRYCGPWKGKRGGGHPTSKLVVTPRGRFGSGALAAEAFGIARGTATRWARLGIGGWSYG